MLLNFCSVTFYVGFYDYNFLFLFTSDTTFCFSHVFLDKR